jgi:hypothetical protein
MTFSPSHPTTMSIPRLRAALNGQVIAPGDAAYDQARTVFFGGIDRRPAVIVRAADASAVAQVVSLARETGLELASAAAATALPATASPTEGSCWTSPRCGRCTSIPNDTSPGPRPA